MESEVEARRTLSIPAPADGADTATMSPTMAMTTRSSIRVTPRLLRLPTDNVRIQSFAARLPVLSQADNVRLVTVLARILVPVVVSPRILGNVLRHIRTVPLVHAFGLDAQRLQALLGGGKHPVIQLVSAHRRHKILDLAAPPAAPPLVV